ncbi:MAG: FdrA family protein [Streptosporangiaceae bacterium]
MSAEHVEARPGAYADSVTLMQASAAARQAGGVDAALVAMATELNLGLLAGLGLPAPAAATANDLLIAVRAREAAALAGALAVIEAALARRPASAGGPLAAAAARTTGAAARAAGPGLALVSVPGRHAFTEAMDALDAGCDVMIFSDNVPVEQEIMLKDAAAQRGLLVLGPDCGAAVVGGIGLGFANAVGPGPVGLVAASGTGAQQLMCLLAAAGTGVSAVLGVGGRDLSAAVGGRSARAALAALDEDPATALIVVVSKPPAPAVAADLQARAAALATPVQFALVAPGEPDLTAAAGAALRALRRDVPAWPRWPGPASTAGPPDGGLRGLFAGGTLCEEAMVIASERLGPIRSNVPLRPEWHCGPQAAPDGHLMIDFGDDELTDGRPHPMIDQSLRLERLAAEAAGPAAGVILLDVVLGHGAHPDPAAELAPVIAAARAARPVTVVVSLIGTAADPQDLAAQARALQAAGAHVFAANAEAARFACAVAAGGTGGGRPGGAAP